MTFLLNWILEFLASQNLRFFLSSMFFLLKSILFSFLIFYRYKNNRLDVKAANMLLIILFSSLVIDGYTVAFTLRNIGLLFLSIENQRILGRICWIANICFYVFLFYFIRQLLHKPLFAFFANFISACGLFLCFTFGVLFLPYIAPIEIFLWQITYFYLLIVAGCIVFEVLKSLKSVKVPLLLRMQLKTLLIAFLIPIFCVKFSHLGLFWELDDFLNIWQALFNIATILLIAATYYTATRLVRIRFLNIKYKSNEPPRHDLTEITSVLIDQFQSVRVTSEFNYITRSLFARLFCCAEERVQLVLFDDPCYDGTVVMQRNVKKALEVVPSLAHFLDKEKLFARSEIELSWYHEEALVYAEAVQFLDLIGADLFIPCFDQGFFIGYVVMESQAQYTTCFSFEDRKVLKIFSKMLGVAVRQVRQKDYSKLLEEKRRLEEEAYFRHRELEHLREGISSYTRKSVDRQIGVLFYRRRKYVFANKSAELLLGCDPNSQRGHPVAEAISKLVEYTAQSKQFSSTVVSLHRDMQLSLMTFPGESDHEVIVIAARPELSDLIAFQENMLKDPSSWDYLLYLETTQEGRRISELIPGVGETLLQIKVTLLRLVFGRSAVFLNSANADRKVLVSLLHEASLGTQLHTLSLTQPEQEQKIAVQLFGVSALFSDEVQEAPLLSRFQKNATLVIENIQYLSIDTQKRLAEFLRIGVFKRIGSSLLVASDIRIICSSDQSLEMLMQEKMIIPELYQELTSASFTIPRPSLLPYEEFCSMVDSMAHFFLTTASLKKVLGLTEREKKQLWVENVSSFDLLKKRVFGLLHLKASSQHVQLTGAAVDAYDDELNRVVLMGSRALKDSALLKYLWDKFKCQAKIASLLGVNKSSVSRRCKMFGIIESSSSKRQKK